MGRGDWPSRACMGIGAMLATAAAGCGPMPYSVVESMWEWPPPRMQQVARLEARIAATPGASVRSQHEVGRWSAAIVDDPDRERCGGAYVLFDDGATAFADPFACAPADDAPPGQPHYEPSSVRLRMLGQSGDRAWAVAERTTSERISGCEEHATTARVYELGPADATRRIDVLVAMRRVDVDGCQAVTRDFAVSLEGLGGERFRLRAARGQTLEGNRWQVGTWTVRGFATVIEAFARNAATRGPRPWWTHPASRANVRDAIAAAGATEAQLTEFDAAFPLDE